MNELRTAFRQQLEQGDRDKAKALLADYSEFTPYLAVGNAVLASAEGDHPLAARMIGVADTAYPVAGEKPEPEDAAELAKVHAAAVEALGESAFADYRADGALWEGDFRTSMV
ncbi:hypothetical protein [Actinoplanes couchii]|uniref:hypothetical protein n=1 Tax=Actinoplanes couchii TaxID=403638 RepID=UPI00286CDA33|nr:hypothetical protein [Actinoplanes couchii]